MSLLLENHYILQLHNVSPIIKLFWGFNIYLLYSLFVWKEVTERPTNLITIMEDTVTLFLSKTLNYIKAAQGGEKMIRPA